jgi:hypothetical protein
VAEQDRRAAEPVQDGQGVLDVIDDAIPARCPARPTVTAVVDQVQMPARSQGGDERQEVDPPAADAVEQD